jgi:hypothetical protein
VADDGGDLPIGCDLATGDHTYNLVDTLEKAGASRAAWGGCAWHGVA